MIASFHEHRKIPHQIQRHDKIIFACHAQPTHLQNITKQSQPLTLVADADLYNRDELLNKLSSKPFVNWNDEQIILAAYKKWGVHCASHFNGDFAFALWDNTKKQLLCCRDHLGHRPFFYYFNSQRFVFASEIKAILSLPDIDKQLNKPYLARFSSNVAKSKNNANTLFAGIKSLAPATLLCLSDKGINKQRYWQPSLTQPLSHQNDADILDEFQSLLFTATSNRLDKQRPTIALLSGGLDSSAIVSSASKCLAKQKKQLITLSSIYTGSHPQIMDEQEYIGQFKDWPNLQMLSLTTNNTGPFDQLEKLIHRVESPLITSRHYLYRAFFEEAERQGVHVILDGVGGEVGPSYSANDYFAELFLQGQWHTLWQQISAHSQVMQTPIWQIFASQVLRPLIKPVSYNFRQYWLQILRGEFIKQHLDCDLNAPAIKRSSLYSHRNAQYHNFLSAQHPSRVHNITGHPDIHRRYPLADIRLLEFCLAAPAHLKVRNGYHRALIRHGLQNVLPPKIQWRTSKTPFSPDYHLRYNEQKSIAKAILDDISANDPIRTVVDVDNLTRLIKHDMTNNRGHTANNFAGLHVVPQGIYLIIFLRQFSEFQP